MKKCLGVLATRGDTGFSGYTGYAHGKTLVRAAGPMNRRHGANTASKKLHRQQPTIGASHMKWHETLRRTVRIMAEHGKVTLSGDLSDGNTVVKLNPKMDHVSFEQMIDDFVSRYPATLEYLRRRWSETH
jgi:hypothetical protein